MITVCVIITRMSFRSLSLQAFTFTTMNTGMHRLCLLIVVYFILLPASRAGFHNEEVSLATMAFFMAGYLFEHNDNLQLFPASLQIQSIIEHPYTSGTRGSASSSSPSTTSDDQPPATPPGCKSFSICLKKLPINNGTPNKELICCHICSMNLATSHLPCCQHPVCRDCRKKSDGSSCPLCQCRICLGFAENRVESSCCHKFFCKSCLDEWTTDTNICPNCKCRICEEPEKKGD